MFMISVWINNISLTYCMEVIYNVIGKVIVDVDYIYNWLAINFLGFRIPLVIFYSIKDIVSVVQSIIVGMVHF